MEALRLGSIRHGFSAERDIDGGKVGDSNAEVVVFNVSSQAPNPDLVRQLRQSGTRLLIGLGAKPSAFTLTYLSSLGLDLIVCEPVNAVATASLIKDEYRRHTSSQTVALLGSPETAERLGSLVSRWTFNPVSLESLITSPATHANGVVVIATEDEPGETAQFVRILRTIETTRNLHMIVLDRLSPNGDSVARNLLPNDAEVVLGTNPDPDQLDQVLLTASLKARSGSALGAASSATGSADWDSTADKVKELVSLSGHNESGLALLHITPVNGNADELSRSQTMVRSSLPNAAMFELWADGLLVGFDANKVEANETLQRLTSELGHSGIEARGALSVLGDNGTTADELLAGLHQSAVRSPAPDASPSTDPAGSGKPSTILVIEDDPLVSTVVLDLITSAGYQVELEADGLSAADLVCDSHVGSRYSLVVMDISLPGLDGFGILRRMQRAATTGLVPVLLLTARANESETVMGLELGASDHVAKPFSPQVLLRRIERLLTK